MSSADAVELKRSKRNERCTTRLLPRKKAVVAADDSPRAKIRLPKLVDVLHDDPPKRPEQRCRDSPAEHRVAPRRQGTPQRQVVCAGLCRHTVTPQRLVEAEERRHACRDMT